MTIEFHPGRLPNNPAKPRLRYAAFTKATPTYPDKLDYLSKVANYPMYLNDRYGDCTFAGAGHIIQAESTYGQGSTQTVSDSDVIKGYSELTGFNPNDPSTDNGAVMQEVLSYWRKTGIGGHQILAFAEVDVTNLDEVRSALDVFGSLYIGINFPSTAMDQFNQGKPWDAVSGARIEGGHAIHGGAYEVEGNWKVVTWGAVQEMTPNFWADYVEEAWVVITPEWLALNGQSPSGFDLHGLGEELAALTGGENPFPPVQPPVPPVGDADQVLEDFLVKFFKVHELPHHPHLEAVLRSWLDTRS